MKLFRKHQSKKFARQLSLSAPLLLGVTITAIAQPMAKKQLPTASGITYLYGGQWGNNAQVPVTEFDTLLSKHLVVKDASGKTFYARSFSFVYVNRGVYSDSIGRPIILNDYLYSASDEGTLPNYWLNGLRPQLKAGDTAIFTDIRYKADTGRHAPLLYGKTMRIILKD